MPPPPESLPESLFWATSWAFWSCWLFTSFPLLLSVPPSELELSPLHPAHMLPPARSPAIESKPVAYVHFILTSTCESK